MLINVNYLNIFLFQPDKGQFKSFYQITFWVGNARVSAQHYSIRMGFDAFAYKGLETGCRTKACHVVKQNDVSPANSLVFLNEFIYSRCPHLQIIFNFQSMLNPYEPKGKFCRSHFSSYSLSVCLTAFPHWFPFDFTFRNGGPSCEAWRRCQGCGFSCGRCRCNFSGINLDGVCGKE